MVGIMDSTLASLNSDLIHGTEQDTDTVADQNYVDLVNLNGGYWDSIRSVWIGEDRLQRIGLDELYYKRKFYSGSAKPHYYAIEGRTLQFQQDADSAHTDLIIHYNKKHRPLIITQDIVFTAANVTEIFTAASAHGFMHVDGPITVANSGGALPTGLSAATNYWTIYISSTTFYMASSKAEAMAESNLTISSDGTGTQTLTQADVMPYDDVFNEFLREMTVMHAKAKKEGVLEKSEGIYNQVFRTRAMQEVIRRNYSPKYYYIDF
jgi:hypothetical protein